ncbi:NERD domain-containing protein [Dysgonomonas macrotermitis]|uniref:Nuclease-related domain-containing protein n=1 Tax=Dysgonomonas macrotermitis TaxID=1346286 RepID=A0A1M4X9T6_9BACT|nr:NERD domain-containing protein [Dysgonomonas macrotermitis]SHE90186.1 Nuclease-related domain-containing protein [Dysgonomonas macrotermitis]
MQNIEQQSSNLKVYISQFDINKAIPLWIFFFNCQMKTESKFIRLPSIVRQMTYLINLSLSNSRKGKDSIYSFSEIVEMLDNIEKYYKEQYDFKEVVDYYGETYRKNLVAQTTYLNYFLNASLVYVEQVIERIQGTFSSLEDFISESINISINDLITFYFETTQISTLKFMECYSNFISQDVDKNADGTYCYPSFENESDTKFISFDLVNQQTFSIDDYKRLDKSKVKKILSLLSLKQTSNLDYLYYTDSCELLNKPIIQLPNNRYVLFFNNQLIISIYNLLYNVCKDKSGKNSDRSRAIYLEEKTIDVFTDFLPQDEIKIFTNYYINGKDNEKDILIFYRRTAFIIECKADLYKEPFRDVEKSYKRTEREFKTSIQKAYDQALEVQSAIYNGKELTISDKNKNEIECIKTNKIENAFIILVTQERFGQIQCDLGLLLEKEGNAFYPWSVSIDDLESILLTISRKENAVGELITYLINREKLHERLICSDELDIVGYFIMQRQVFIQHCNRDEIYITSPDVCHLFDDLYYHGGFGFKNELYLDSKFEVSIPAFVTSELCKKLKLRTPKNIQKFKKENNIDNERMNEFRKEFYDTTEILEKYPEKKDLLKQILGI